MGIKPIHAPTTTRDVLCNRGRGLAAILEHRAALDQTQPWQFFVDSVTLAYKNVNLFSAIYVIFADEAANDAYEFCLLFYNYDLLRI